MSERSLDSLGRQQLAVLNVLWDMGEASVHDVRQRLARRRPLAYTTVLSTLQKLEKLGWVVHEARGRTYIYRATCSRSAAGARSARSLVARLFRGDPLALFESLIEQTPLDADELKKLRRMIDERRKEFGE